MRNECVALLSGLAYLGNDDEGAAIPAFRKRAARLGMREARILAADQVDIVSVDRALDKIALLTPRYKKVVLQACAACISADKEITVREGELFRGIADVLDCPMPPLLPGQKLA